jgi:hypothetical protein
MALWKFPLTVCRFDIELLARIHHFHLVCVEVESPENVGEKVSTLLE